jgi:hypothetical protein
MYKVTYHTMNDTYTKTFRSLEDAEKFRKLIKVLYPEQNPVIK